MPLPGPLPLVILLTLLLGCVMPVIAVEIDQQAALGAHNAVRAGVNQGAYTNQPIPNPKLSALFWSNDLAADAEAYAESCTWSHSDDRINTGENLYATTATNAGIEQAVAAWAGEYRHYDFYSGSCAQGEQCGHYTQLVWQDSLLVGCGKAQCNPLRYPNGGTVFNRADYMVCRYATAGNIADNHPYDTTGIAPAVTPTYDERNQTLTLPYFLLWHGNNLVQPFSVDLTLVKTTPITFAVDSLIGVGYQQLEHNTIYDVHSSRLFLPNLDTLLGGAWSRHSAVLEHVPGSSDPYLLVLKQFQ